MRQEQEAQPDFSEYLAANAQDRQPGAGRGRDVFSINKLEQKYANMDEEDEEAVEDEFKEEEAKERAMVGVVSQESLLPSVRDPKLWLVRCDPGEEQQSVLTLMQRFYAKEKSENERLFIKSAFTTPAAKGYVYVEAEKDAHVKRAIQGIRALKAWKMDLVPIKEMVQAITVKPTLFSVKPGQWVRIKTGLYKNDLAQVVSTEDQDTQITVKIIPRINMADLKAEADQKARDAEDGEDGKKTRRPPKKMSFANRPLQRLFNPTEVRSVFTFDHCRLHVA